MRGSFQRNHKKMLCDFAQFSKCLFCVVLRKCEFNKIQILCNFRIKPIHILITKICIDILQS